RTGKVAALGLIVVLALAACGKSGGGEKDTSSAGFSECDKSPNTCNGGDTKPGGTLTVVIEKKLPNWNTFDSDGNTYETGQVMAGLLPAPIVILPDSTPTWNKQLFSEEPKVEGESPMKVTLKIRPEAVWNDG